MTSTPSSLSGVDITAAYQWDFNVTTVGQSFSANNVFAIPEPGSLAVVGMLALAGLGLGRRRRQ